MEKDAKVAEALIEQKLPNGKLIDKQTALDGLARVIPMLQDGWDKDFEVFKEDEKLNNLVRILNKGNEFIKNNT